MTVNLYKQCNNAVFACRNKLHKSLQHIKAKSILESNSTDKKSSKTQSIKVTYQEKFGFTFSSLGRLVSHYTWQQGIQTASHKCPWLFRPPHCKPIWDK